MKALFFCAVLIAELFASVRSQIGTSNVTGGNCDAMPSPPGAGFIGGSYSQDYMVRTGIYCPAHTVNDGSFQRGYGGGMICYNMGAYPPAWAIQSNCPTSTPNATANTTTTTAAPCTTTPATLSWWLPYWNAMGWNCVAATCLPACLNGGTCYCGLSCRCACVYPYTGADCSVDSTTIPAAGSTVALYAFADPHFMIQPLKSSNPWVMDLSGNGLHAEIIGWVGLDEGNNGPFGRALSSLAFGLNPNAEGFMVINDTSYNLGLLKMQVGTSTYSVSMHYKPLTNQYNNESTLFQWKSQGATKGAAVTTTLDVPTYYYRSSIGGYVAHSATYPTQNVSANAWTLVSYIIDEVGLRFKAGTNTNSVSSGVIQSLGGSTASGFFIGDDNSTTQLQIPLHGNIGSMQINNATVAWGHAGNYQTFVQNNFGQGNATVAIEQLLTPCPVPPTGSTPTTLYVNATVGATIETICPPFSTFITPTAHGDIAGPRAATVVCGAQGWNRSTGCTTYPLPNFCDPVCINGGTCMCSTWYCYCQCWSGYTGPDCFAPTSAIPANLTAFWPLTQDTMAIGGTTGLLGDDFAGTHTMTISNAGFDVGPWGVLKTAFRQHYLRGISMFWISNPFTLFYQDFTVLFYIKIPHTPGSIPTRPQLPLFVYSSPPGSGSHTQMSIYLDETTGFLVFYPGAITIAHNGPPITTNASSWVPVSLSYSIGLGKMGSSSWDYPPLLNTTITIPAPYSNTTLYFGYDDIADLVSDMSVTCIGVYKIAYTSQMAWDHGKVCQMFSKQQCQAAPYPTTPAVQSGSSTYSAGIVTYTCFNGYIWNTTGTMSLSFGCGPNQSMIPKLSWGTSTVPGVCQADPNTCHPTCQNAATCTATTPAKCVCVAGFIGLDCSIPANIFPSSCNLVSLWPLTTMHINSAGQAADIWGSNHATINTSSIFFPDNVGPFTTSGVGVAQFVGSLPGSVQVTAASTPIPSGSSFLVSAFIRFDASAGSTSTDLYPFITFTNQGVINSPAVYISPNGNGILFYKAGTVGYNVTFDAGGLILRTGSTWAFLAIQYDSSLNTISMSVNGSVFGAPATLAITAMMSTHTLYIGSVDSGQVWPGQIACLSIYNWILTTPQIVMLMDACEEILGGNTTSAAPTTCNACSGLNLPPSGYAKADHNDVVIALGTPVVYRAPPFTMFPGAPNPLRSFVTICQATGLFTPTVPAVVTVGMVACDPSCMNGGLCFCNGTYCWCSCLPGYTGKDCVIATSTFAIAPNAFWPLTEDSMLADLTTPNKTYATDFSGNSYNLEIGATVALVNNPFFTAHKGAVRFRNGQPNSFLRSLATLNFLNFDSAFTILFYLMYNPASGSQPILAYSSNILPSSQLWLDQITGKVSYFPGGTLLPVTGSNLASTLMSWATVDIGGATLQVGTSTNNNAPATTAAISSVSANANLYIGYSDFPSPVTADLSIACLGIYPVAFSTALITQHGQACQIFNKATCNLALGPPTNAVQTGIQTYANQVISFYCWSGYYFPALSQRFSRTCQQSTLTLSPSLSFTAAPPASCTMAVGVTCYPSCLNGGTCVAGAPSQCSCKAGYSGLDCSINLATLPLICKLTHLWPLTTQHLDSSGKAFDIQQQPLTVAATVTWPEYIALNMPLANQYGIASYSLTTVAGAAQVALTSPPFLSDSSFTISAYVRFELTSMFANYYPLIAFTTIWASPAPAILISPSGSFVMLYKYGNLQKTVFFSLPAGVFIGMQPWAFVSIRFDASSGKIDATLNGIQVGTAVAVSPLPMFSPNVMYVGSTDVAPPFGCQFLEGQVACLSIYSVALTTANILQLKLACDAILGGPAAPNVTVTCDTCTAPPNGGLALQATTDLTYSMGAEVDYTAPANLWYPPQTTNSRVQSSICTANLTWNPPSVPPVDYSTPTVRCDPTCMLGSCRCVLGTGCSCTCSGGATGLDCNTPTATLAALAPITALWPLTADTIARDVSNNTYAIDLSGTGQSLKIASNVILENGPFADASIYSGFRFRSQSPGAVLQSYAPHTLPATLTVIFYVKFNSKNAGHQPLFSWPTPKSQFWISAATGNILYYPGAITLVPTGPNLLASPDTWVPVVISLSANMMGVSTFDNTPVLSTPITPTTAATFYVGQSDSTTPITYSDVSIACLGIYQRTFSTALTTNHGLLCQKLSKVKCAGAPILPIGSVSVAVGNSDSTAITGNFGYSCIGGYRWSSSLTQYQKSTCITSPTSLLLPTYVWSPATLTGTCQPSTSAANCYPPCAATGTCTYTAGSLTSVCVCQSGYAGLDCSLNLAMYPMYCEMISYWPLLTETINNLGKATDIMRTSTAASLPLGSIYFSASGIPLFGATTTPVGSVQVATPYPWPPLSSFTVTAYIRFNKTASYNFLYPLVSYANTPGLTSSPAVFISPSAAGRLYFISAGVAYSVNFTAAATMIGLGPRAFVSIVYSSTTNQVQLTISPAPPYTPVIGTSVTLPAQPVFTTTNALNIGSTDMTPPIDGASVFEGDISCLSLHKIALSSVQIANMYTACQNALTQTAGTAVAQCPSACSSPPVGSIVLPSQILDTYTLGQSISYTCPVFTRQVAPYTDRNFFLTCTGNETWLPLAPPQCDYSNSPRMCDPTCLNGGQCICRNSACSCSCLPGYTGSDCFISQSLVPSGAVAFWPLTVDTVIRDPTQNITPLAADLSSNNLSISIGQGAGFDVGPFSSTQSAMRFRSAFSQSYLSLLTTSPLPLSTSQAFSILFFVKVDANAVGNQPMLAFSGGGSAFWLDMLMGQVRYNPGNQLLTINGPSPISTPGSWMPFAITFSPPNVFGAATNGNLVTVTSTAVADFSGTFFAGYSDSPVPTVSDMSISCIGIYNAPLTNNLWHSHVEACSVLSKQSCSLPPAVAGAYTSEISSFIGISLTYTCIGEGNYFQAALAKSLNVTCAQTVNTTTPVVSWSPTVVTDICIASATACYPSCLNNGICSTGVCQCPTGFAGIDCSIRLETITCQSHLQSFWPLTTNQISSSGSAVDIWSSLQTTVLPSANIRAVYDGPFAPNSFALFQMTSITAGSVMVSSPNWPSIPTNGTFFISAYVKFDLTASFNTLYPFVTFTKVDGISGSPALFISKSGTARMYYSSGGLQEQVDFAVPPPNVIGTATPLSFVRVEYDWDTGNISVATLNYNTMQLVYGDPVTLPSEPNFPTNAAMLIGSTDMVGLPGCGTVFPGEIACLAVYNSTLGDVQTKQVISACWDMLGGPPADIAVQACGLIPYCNFAPNVTNATLELTYMAPPLPGTAYVNGTYTDQSVLYYLCEFDHAFANYTVVDMNATCVLGQWQMPFTGCPESRLQRNPYLIDIVLELPDDAILKYFDQISDMILQTSLRIINLQQVANLTVYATTAVDAITTLYDRFIGLTDRLTPSQILKLSSNCATGLAKLAWALVNDTQIQSAINSTTDRIQNCSVDYYRHLPTTTPRPNTTVQLTANQLATIFGQVNQMTSTLSQSVQNALTSGSTFSIDEQFFGAKVLKMPLGLVPGLLVNLSLASVRFPSDTNLVDEAYLSPTSIVSVVVMAFIDNVFDLSKPFNIPTVSVRIFAANLLALTLRQSLLLDVVAVPIRPKALLYSNEKVVVQCDISNITCDVTTNADLLASLVRVPIIFTAGNFFITFPPNWMPYDIYISINSNPDPKQFLWHLRVSPNGQVTYDVTSSNSALAAPTKSYDSKIGLNLVISSSVIATLRNTTSGTVFLAILMKRDCSAYTAADDLPSSLCQLQHAYAYQISLGNARPVFSWNRKKRQTSSSNQVCQTNCTLTLLPGSSETAIKFKSNYFGDFGANLVIAPNTIEFSDVFSRFTTLVADNSAVLAFMVICIVLFLAAVGFTHYFDKKDVESWAFLPVVSNQPSQKVKYYMSVQYHSVKNFDLVPQIYIRFLGDICDLYHRRLDDGVRKNFFGSHSANFLVTAHHPIGDIDEIEIFVSSKFKSRERLFSLHIDKVFVICATSGKKFLFPVKKRIYRGQSCFVKLANEDDVKTFKYLVSGHTRGEITEGHPWLSILKRPLPSHWTRVERLGCVVSALFMTMLVNAMFYGKDATVPRVGIEIGNFIRISWFTIWTSILGSLIVIPPTAVMAFIFRHIRRKSAADQYLETVFNIEKNVKEIYEQDGDDDDQGVNSSQQLKKNKPKKPLLLPQGCVAIAWFLVFACIACSAFFVVMYSLTWGSVKSLQWLTGMLLHIVQDIIIIQTVKVFLISVVSSTLLQLPNDGMLVGKITYHAKNQKQQTELFARFRNVIAGISHHILHVLAFSLVITTAQNQFAYKQVADVKQLVLVNGIDPVLGTIPDYSTIFFWLGRRLLPNLMSGNLLSQGGYFTEANIYTVPNHDVVLIGPIRLRQQRVQSARCLVESNLSPFLAKRYSTVLFNFTTKCQDKYADNLGVSTSSEKHVFNNSWDTPIDGTNLAAYISSNTQIKQTPWAYRDTDGPPYAGWQATYFTNGYYIDLPLDLSSALSTVGNLAANRWLDNSTSVLLVEFTLFNAQINLFLPVKIVFEALEAGGMLYHARIYPLQLYEYVGAQAMLNIAIQAIWILLTFSHIYKIFRLIKRDGAKAYFKDGWNIFDVCHVLLCISIIGLFCARIVVIVSTISNMKTYKTAFCNLDLLANWEDLMFCLYGIAFFMALLLFFRHLSFNKHWAIFLATLSKAKMDIISFIVVFVLLTFMFSALGYSALGPFFVEYSSLSKAVMTLVQNIIGVNGSFLNISSASTFARVFTLSYSFVSIFLAVQVFMAIMNFNYNVIASNVTKETQWDVRLSEYISQSIKELFTKKASHKATMTNLDHDDISAADEEEVARVVDRLEKLVNKNLDSVSRSDRDVRGMVSWMSFLMMANKEDSQNKPLPPPLPPIAMIKQKQDIDEANHPPIAEIRRKSSSAVMRNEFWQYLNDPPGVDFASIKNPALERLNSTRPDANIYRQPASLESTAEMTEDDEPINAAGNVYSSDYLNKPSLQAISPAYEHQQPSGAEKPSKLVVRIRRFK